MDFRRRKAVFSGAKIPSHYSEIIRGECIAIGNMLSWVGVVSSMVESFENSNGNFPLRLLQALKAGSESGGDRRGERSAALVIINTENVILNLKVDSSRKPIYKLLQLMKQP